MYFNQGVFPNILKIANVIPIHKKSDKLDYNKKLVTTEHLRDKYPPESISCKPCENGDIDFSNSHMTSCWPLDQRVIFGSL